MTNSCCVERSGEESFLKVRFIPSNTCLDLLKWNAEVENFEDAFYDTRGTKYGKDKCFLRRRTSKSGAVCVHQIGWDIIGYSRIYTEKAIDCLPEEVIDELVTYRFQRKSIKSTKDWQVYIDSVLDPILYDVVSVKVRIENVLDSPDCDKLVADVRNYFNLNVVFTSALSKFMYILRCSKHFRLYDKIFCVCDEAADIDDLADAILEKEQSVVDDYSSFLASWNAVTTFENVWNFVEQDAEKALVAVRKCFDSNCQFVCNADAFF